MRLNVRGLTFRLSVAVLLTTGIFASQAVAVERQFYAGGSLSLQLFRDGTAVSGAFPNAVRNFLGIDDNGAQVNFGGGQSMLFYEFTPSPNGPAAYNLPYFNPSNTSDPLNNTTIDLRNLAVTLTGTVPTSGTAFNTAGLAFGFANGTFDLAGPTHVDLTGDSGFIANVPDGSSILGTYTIPINVDIPISTPFGNIDAVFSGNITAVALPEPGTMTLVGVGFLLMIPLLRRVRGK
jgi:hypothetical protein